MATTKIYFTSSKTDLLENLNNLTPKGTGRWGPLERIYDSQKADYIVVLEDAEPGLDLSKYLDKLIAFPLDLKPKKNYLRYSFPHRFTWGSPRERALVTLKETGETYDSLRAMSYPKKTKELSCVLFEDIPEKALQWLKDLVKVCPIDLYGSNLELGGLSTYCGEYTPNAYRDYYYSIVFENAQMENYLTERFTHCVLLGCIPFYWGCPNRRYLSALGKSIDLTFPNKCHIQESIVACRHHSSIVEEELKKARSVILDQLNVWAQVQSISVKDFACGTPDSIMDSKGKEKVADFSEIPPEKTFEDTNVAKDGICLIMIVRDESHVIERCLKSVVNVISSYCICDTGSLDNTPQIIENFMESHGIPGQVIYKEWKNFGYNKSYLIRRAYEDNLALGAKYLMWLDADEVFQNQAKENLTSEDGKKLLEFANARPNMGVFMFMTHYGGLEYQRWNMVRNNQLYEWRCPVHEYLHHTEPTGTVFVDFMTVLARKEGARTRAGDSGQKDIKMFEEYLEEHPTCSRSTFYLAQTLGESGQLERAIEMYEKRIGMVGFYQERYIAALRMGHHHRKLGHSEKALEVWEKHWPIVPNRLEIPYYYMMYLKDLKRYPDAYEVGARAYQLHKCNMNDLFVEKGIYNWRFFMEFSVIAYYTQHYQMAYELGKKLLSEGKYPDAQAKVVEKNMSFFRSKVTTREEIPPTLSRKFNFHPPGIIVIDDFLPNPDEVRKFALAQEFTVTGNYPGRRTKSFATPDHKEAFERIMGKKIIYWPDQYNGAFQYTFGDHKSWIHRDLTDYSALIYLTPDPPADGGTLVYRHKELGIERDSEGTKDQIKQMNDDSSDESKWEIMDVIANKYNRLIIFTGRRSHKSNKYFGSTKETGRLFQTFFFNVEGYH